MSGKQYPPMRDAFRNPMEIPTRRKILGWFEVSRALVATGFDWKQEIREHASTGALAQVDDGWKVRDVEINEGVSNEELRRLHVEPEPPGSDLFIVITMTTLEVIDTTTIRVKR